MGRNIKVTNSGVYIEINKTEEEISNYFEDKKMDICEWVEEQKGKLYHQGEMSQKHIFVNDSKYDLSGNIGSSDIDKLHNLFTKEYESILSKLMNMFGDDNIDVKIGIIEYWDEIA